MSSFSVLVILGIVLAVLGLVFLLLSLYKSSEGDYYAASGFEKMFVISFMCSAVFIVIVFIVSSTEGIQQSQEMYKKEMYKKAMTAYNKGADVYIDGEPVSDNFDINGIDLHDYTIKIENNTLYLIKK